MHRHLHTALSLGIPALTIIEMLACSTSAQAFSGSFSGDASAQVLYTYYPSPGTNEAFFRVSDAALDTAYGGIYAGIGALGTDDTGAPAVFELNYVDATSPIIALAPTTNPAQDCGIACSQALKGNGSVSIIDPLTGATSFTGALGAGAIYAFPGQSAAVLSYILTSSTGPVEYLTLIGSTSSPVALCTQLGGLGSGLANCSGQSFDSSQPQFFNSFTLDWSAMVSASPYVPSAAVPEPGSWALLLLALGALAVRTRQTMEIRAVALTR